MHDFEKQELLMKFIVFVFIVGCCSTLYYLITNTSYISELKDCYVHHKEFKPSYYTTECNPVYRSVTRTHYNSDGTSYTTVDMEFSHNEYYQLFHPEQYLIGVSDGDFRLSVDNKQLYDVLNMNQHITMAIKYRCWKGKKTGMVQFDLVEQL